MQLQNKQVSALSPRAGIVLLVIISATLLSLCCLSLVVGARPIPLDTVKEAIFNTQMDDLRHRIVLERMPRTAFALIAGASLGVSGALMQAITRNPIADPSILGINTGAALFVVIGLTFFNVTLPLGYITWALVGAFITAVLVFTIANIGYGGATPIKLALAGAAVTAALASLISALILPRIEVMNAFRFWQIGTLSGATWEGILWSLPLICLAMALAFATLPALDALALGEEMASALGVRAGQMRLLGAISAITLCAVTTALGGPIAFVGLMVPHLVKALVGISMRLIVPYSALIGACLLLLSDILGRYLVAPGELEVGIITALMGAPILIIMVRRTRIRL